MDKDLQSIQEARQLVKAAHTAWKQFEHFSADQVERILEAISVETASHAARLAEMAVRETGFGNVPDKTAKNLFSARDVYRAMRPLETIGIIREDREKRILEVATPVGVIAGVIPSTNPTSTTIYKALIALKGRNAIVFSPHPSAAESIGETVRVIAQAAEAAGAPAGIVSSMTRPTLEGTNELMRHPGVRLILATGGPGLVRAAYSAGKPAFGVGPGNVPAYVEKSADVPKAVRDILTGKCFDNGTLCSSEQSLVADREIAGLALRELEKNGAFLCRGEDRQRLEALIRNPRGGLNTAIVGRSAARIAEMAGIQVPAETRALVGEEEGVGPDHPLSMEKLSPILAFYQVEDWKEGCRLAIRILEFGGLGHTLGLHTSDDEVVRAFALEKPASRICVNTPAALGAVGLTTSLFPSMTLGCGAFGNNITSDNISPLHLINVKRVAWGVREFDRPSGEPQAETRPASEPRRGRIAAIVDDWAGRRGNPAPTPSASPEPETAASLPPPTAPRLGSYAEVDPAAPSKPDPVATGTSRPAPVGFVCEDDVRAASRSHASIPVDGKTIITPSARELGEQLGVFETVG